MIYPLVHLIPRFILREPLVPPPAHCWCRGLVPCTCREVQCGAWVPKGSHTCRAAPKPTSSTYTTPHPTFITCSSGPPLLDRRLGDQPSTLFMGERAGPGEELPAGDFLTPLPESTPRSMEAYL